VSAEGFEPSTNGLKGHCSAIELRARTIRRQQSGLHFIMLNWERQRNKLPGRRVYRVLRNYLNQITVFRPIDMATSLDIYATSTIDSVEAK
jgi:hypothetical protein